MHAPEFKVRLSDKGVVTFLDLDNFKHCVEEKNWSKYTPNPITRFLTVTIEQYIRKYRALSFWGLDQKRGTEEAILFFQYEKSFVLNLIDDLRKDIMNLAQQYNASTSLSAGLAEGKIPKIKNIKNHSKSEFKKDPTIFLAYRALKKAKKQGGNSIVTY